MRQSLLDREKEKRKEEEEEEEEEEEVAKRMAVQEEAAEAMDRARLLLEQAGKRRKRKKRRKRIVPKSSSSCSSRSSRCARAARTRVDIFPRALQLALVRCLRPGSTVATCSCVSLAAFWKFPVFLRDDWPRILGRFSGDMTSGKCECILFSSPVFSRLCISLWASTEFHTFFRFVDSDSVFFVPIDPQLPAP